VVVRRLLLLLLLISLLATACAGQPTTSDWDTSSPFAGFALSPPSLDQGGFEDYFDRIELGADLVAWVGAWQNIDDATSVYEMAEERGYVPVVVTGFPTGTDGLREVPEDPSELLEKVSNWVADHPVPFLGFGVEVNAFLYERAPEDFEWFVDTFPEIVASVHEVSPDTIVFPGFQLERLRGLKGGLFGEADTLPVWDLIDRFPDADAIGFTSYPGLIFTAPDQIPSDYYTEITAHTDKPIVFTELGWQAGGDLLEWSGTPEKQAEFVTTQVAQLAEMSEMIIWSFLYDQQVGGAPFETMGLIDNAGTERIAWHAWLEIFG
jgi:hypothetical protein